MKVMEDQHRTIVFVVAMAGIMILKSLFFPCNCQVPQTETPALAGKDAVGNLLPKGVVTMINPGAGTCIPCKMMAPIIEKLEKDYRGKAAILFVDINEDREQAKAFGIRAIPTQILFDRDGREVYRHTGFLSEKAIVQRLERMGVGQVKTIS